MGKAKKEWGLSEAKLSEYREAFPGVDALGESRKALQWLRDNPQRRKTAQGMAAFLTRWLGKAQNASSGPRAAPTAEADEKRRQHSEAMLRETREAQDRAKRQPRVSVVDLFNQKRRASNAEQL